MKLKLVYIGKYYSQIRRDSQTKPAGADVQPLCMSGVLLCTVSGPQTE